MTHYYCTANEQYQDCPGPLVHFWVGTLSLLEGGKESRKWSKAAHRPKRNFNTQQ